MASDRITWTPEEYDLMAKAALAAFPEGGPRHEMMRAGQQVLPKARQKDVPDHLGGKSFAGFKAALARAQARRDNLMTQKRNAAAKARAAMALKREEAEKAGIPIKYKPRAQHTEDIDPNSMAGRIVARLLEMGKGHNPSRALADGVGLTVHSIRQVLYHGKGMKPDNLAKVAEYLSLPVQQLLGDSAPASTTAVVPLPKGEVFRGNGKPHALAGMMKADVAMSASHQATISALFPLLPPDVQAYVIARTAELVAMQARK